MNWLRQHLLACADAVRQIAARPGSFVLNVLVISIALALPVTGLTLLENIRPVSQEIAVEPEISIFMDMDTPRERASALGGQIRRIVQEARLAGRLEFVPREQALTALKDRSGLSEALTVLGENPLPDGYVLRITGLKNTRDAQQVDMVATRIKALPGVEFVQVDSSWVKRLAALMDILRLGLLLLGASLSVVVVAVVFNTIRLQLVTQRPEIEVSRLFGATDAYIRRPFYYAGALLGIVSGLAALAAVALLLQPLNRAIHELTRLYASSFALSPLPAEWILGLVGISALLGLFGTALSIRQHLA